MVNQCLESGSDFPDYPGVLIGQNIGGGQPDFTTLINSWFKERNTTDYIYGKGYIKGVGHYFQVSVNAGSEGCMMCVSVCVCVCVCV